MKPDKIVEVDRCHDRVITDWEDGSKQSVLMHYPNGGNGFTNPTPIEITDHHKDGTSTSYEVNHGFWGWGKGKQKN